jgi:hypothetical protein
LPLENESNEDKAKIGPSNKDLHDLCSPIHVAQKVGEDLA